MPDLSNNNSFIPKRGPVNKKKSGATSRPVYVFTLISYILMFATLIAVAGSYFYSKVVDQKLQQEVALLNTEISSFSEADMQKVLDFDARLIQAADRLNNSVSVASVFDSLEAATIDTVQISTLDLVREADDQFVLSAAIATDSFDSTIFQRGVYQRNQSISDIEITALTNGVGLDQEGNSNAAISGSGPIVSFIAKLTIPLSSVPYVVGQTAPAPIIITEPVVEEIEGSEIEITGDDLEVNNDNI